MNSRLFIQHDSFFQKLLKTLNCYTNTDSFNVETSLSNYIQVFSRISFNFLLLIIIFLCGFIGFNFGGRGFRLEDDFGKIFGISIFALSLIFVLYNFTNKSQEVYDRLFIIYNILVDIYFAVLAFDTNYQDKSFPYFLRILYFYMLSATIFLLFRYETSTKELLSFIIYKIAGFLILIFTNNHTKYYGNFLFEFGFLFFWVISLFIYKQIREDYLNKSLEYFCEQKYQNQYYQGLINMINKSFLSLNVSINTLTFNKPFENFLKMLGLTDDDIKTNLKDQNNKNPNFMNSMDNNNSNSENNNTGTQKNLNQQNFNNNNQFYSNLISNKNNIQQQGQKIEMMTQNDISNMNSNSNMNIINTNNNLNNNLISSNSLFPFNPLKNFNNSGNNIQNTYSNINANSIYTNNNFGNNKLMYGNSVQNMNNAIYDSNNMNNNINNLNSSLAKSSNSNNNINYNNVGSNFTFLNNSANNLRNNLNARANDRVIINNSNQMLMNNPNMNIIKGNINYINNKKMEMNFNNNFDLKDNVNNNNFFTSNILKNDEDQFIKKLDFILNAVFINFFEETSNMRNPNSDSFGSNPQMKNTINNQIRNNMSQVLRSIFYSRFNLTLNDGFVFKGIFSTLPNFPVQMTVELYYRKILTYQGDVIEFYFNDITSTRIVETEKANNKIRSLVLAKISHEFKVPLISIIYILKSYIKKNNTNEINTSMIKGKRNSSNFTADDYIRNTINLGDYMLSLINDIIDYSIINSDFDFKCDFENFEFLELMEFSFRILKNLLICKGLSDAVMPILEIDPRVPKYFCNDEKRIKQILLNFLTNSIKFTKRGHIKISAILLEDNSIKISVEDTGCGIESEILQGIFNDIYSLNMDHSEKSTSGLGLSISKKIIDKIGNKIECSSIINQKTIFSFSISSKDDENNLNTMDKNENDIQKSSNQGNETLLSTFVANKFHYKSRVFFYKNVTSYESGCTRKVKF